MAVDPGLVLKAGTTLVRQQIEGGDVVFSPPSYAQAAAKLRVFSGAALRSTGYTHAPLGQAGWKACWPPPLPSGDPEQEYFADGTPILPVSPK